MFYKLQAILMSFILSGCAAAILAPTTIASAAAEHKTGKSPISTFLSRVTGDDCDVKRVLKADYPCVTKKEANEINKVTSEGNKP
jgi:hypothetical protein